jgi:pimeloyl-ACP methyl ester carboxylesterase
VADRPLVLVPGACLGGWAWQGVARRLRGAGHNVYPVTLTGLGDRSHLASPAVDLETHVTDVVNLLDHEDLHHAVLVGHSYAGTVVRAVADRRPIASSRTRRSSTAGAGPCPTARRSRPGSSGARPG